MLIVCFVKLNFNQSSHLILFHYVGDFAVMR